MGDPRDTRAIEAAHHNGAAVFLEPPLRNEAEVVADHEQQEQGNGERNAHGQRLHRAVRLSLVADQVDQRGGQAGNDDDEKGDDDESHVGTGRYKWNAV